MLDKKYLNKFLVISFVLTSSFATNSWIAEVVAIIDTVEFRVNSGLLLGLKELAARKNTNATKLIHEAISDLEET
jgi:hypothetical protein